MVDNIITLSDKAVITDKLGNFLQEKFNGGVKKTLITIKENGEVVDQLHNKIVITGSAFNAIKAFGVNSSIIMPNYNDDMDLDNTLDYSSVIPENDKLCCVFCVDDSGCGAQPGEVYPVKYIDRISPKTIFPFKYNEQDIDDNLRKIYFGRKTLDSGKIAYYFKGFDTTPTLNIRLSDGTQIVGDSIYSIDTDQIAECYIELRLSITREDIRDYFDTELGWDKARVSSLSLCHAWYTTIDGYRYYQQIQPFSKLNFSYRLLTDLTSTLEFEYLIYF
jgi:hypothetical protein